MAWIPLIPGNPPTSSTASGPPSPPRGRLRQSPGEYKASPCEGRGAPAVSVHRSSPGTPPEISLTRYFPHKDKVFWTDEVEWIPQHLRQPSHLIRHSCAVPPFAAADGPPLPLRGISPARRGNYLGGEGVRELPAGTGFPLRGGVSPQCRFITVHQGQPPQFREAELPEWDDGICPRSVIFYQFTWDTPRNIADAIFPA